MPINRENVSPGLLVIADIIVRIPERKDALIAYALKRRERERMLAREARLRLSWHPWQTVKSIFIYGLNGFALAWATGALSTLGRSYQAFKTGSISLPLPATLPDISFGIGSFVPTSTAMTIASHLPQLTLRDALVIGLVVALAVVIERTVVTVIHWKQSRALGEAETELTAEIEELRRWQKMVDPEPKRR